MKIIDVLITEIAGAYVLTTPQKTVSVGILRNPDRTRTRTREENPDSGKTRTRARTRV